MVRRSGFIFAVLILLLGILAYLSLFTVHQTRQALVLQLGDPRRVIVEPGLHVKLPFVQNVVYIDKRILNFKSPPEELIAVDQKRLIVDSFTRYKITDPLQFFKSLGNNQRANSRLSAIVSSSMRSVVGEAIFEDIVRDSRQKLMTKIRHLVNEQTKDFGIAILDVRIRRADLPEANSQAIYRRMQTERQQKAAQIRAKGQEVSRSIRAQADKNVSVLLAESTRDAEIIRGQGDGCRNRIFAIVYGQDPDFFSFYRSMKSYEISLSNEETTFVLSPKNSFFKYLNNPNAEIERYDMKMDHREAINLEGMLSSGKNLRDSLCPEILAKK